MSRRIGSAVFGSVALLCGILPTARAEAQTGKRPLDLESVLERPGAALPELRWLPDGDRIMFTLGHYYQPQRTVILSTTTGKKREISGLELNFDGSAKLSEGGTRLAYLKHGWLWVLRLDRDGEPRRIAKLNLALGKAHDDSKVFCWGEENRAIYYTQRPKRPGRPKAAPDEPTAVDFDPNAKLPLPLEVHRLDLATKKTQKVGLVDADIRSLAWDFRRSELHVVAVRVWGYNEKKIWSAILALDPKTGHMRDVLRTAGANQFPASTFSPDGKWIASSYDTENVIYDYRNHVVVVDVATGEERRLAPGLHVSDDLQWSPDSQAVYALGLIAGYNGVYRLGLDGSVTLLESGERYLESFALSPDGKRYASLASDGYGRSEIRLTDSDGMNSRVLLTIDDPTREFSMGEFRVISWPSYDGLRISGYEIRPAGFDSKKRYPMLVDVHGGGPGSRLYLQGGVLVGTPLERHLWAAMGYVVLVPDYRSAAPYGPGVIEKMRGKAFSPVDVKDVMAGVDFMVGQGYVDSDRIALLGQSAGAHRVNLLLPTTTRFRVAISNEGWANGWIADSTGEFTGHWETTLEWFFKTTRAENPEPWFAEDPIQRLHEIQTPTLLISGAAELGGIGGMTNEYLFSVLRRKGVDTKLILFPDEGHGTTRLANRRYVLKAAVDWVEKHMDLKRDRSGALVFEKDSVASGGKGEAH